MSKIRAALSKVFSKKNLKWMVALVAVLGVGGFLGYRFLKKKQSALPEGIASGNGRLESKEVDVASKLPLRIKDINVEEGDLVTPGQVLVQMDTVTLEAELAEAQESVAAAREQLAVAQAAIARSASQIELARIEKERSRKLVEERAGSQREYDVRSMTLKTTRAGLAEEVAKLEVAKRQVKVAQANVDVIQSRIDDATLRSPVFGRVLYRLTEPGEVVAAGGRTLTLVNLEDVYMEIFLPSEQAGEVKLGSEARFTVDHQPDAVIVGFVSFVSPEAQFTPKEVETRSEREKLMFRVKIQVPKELIAQYVSVVKTGIRGVGYVKLNEDAVWPDFLDRNLIQPAPSQQVEPSPVTVTTSRPRMD